MVNRHITKQRHEMRRFVTPETPVRIEYRLTDKGRALAPAVTALVAWADEWIPPESVGLTEVHGPHALGPG